MRRHGGEWLAGGRGRSSWGHPKTRTPFVWSGLCSSTTPIFLGSSPRQTQLGSAASIEARGRPRGRWFKVVPLSSADQTRYGATAGHAIRPRSRSGAPFGIRMRRRFRGLTRRGGIATLAPWASLQDAKVGKRTLRGGYIVSCSGRCASSDEARAFQRRSSATSFKADDCCMGKPRKVLETIRQVARSRLILEATRPSSRTRTRTRSLLGTEAVGSRR